MKFQEFFEEVQKYNKFDSNTINELINAVQAILLHEPMVIEIEEGANSIFVGDTHGDFQTCVSILKLFIEENYRFIFFLGDYVDRSYGDMQLKLVNLLLVLKKFFPARAFLLRGNHEWHFINAEYGFKEAIYHHLNPLLFQRYNELFNQLPIAVVIKHPSILAVHGGVPISDNELPYTIKEITRIPKKTCFEDKLAQQILWNDPSEKEPRYVPNYRGLGYIFGEAPFLKFMDFNRLEYCIRSHEVKKNGYQQHFKGRLFTIFTSKSYKKKVRPHILLVTSESKFQFREINERERD
ncbi:MAG: metallophosphoesterase [Candidatus Helarchaeota archaeon]